MADDGGAHPADCGERVRGCYSPPRVLWMKLRDGVRPRHLVAFYYAVFMTIASYTFVNLEIKSVMTVILGYDEHSEDFGQLIGNLGAYSELVIIATVTAWGVFSDKTGRHVVYAAGFLLMALGFALTSYATSYNALVGYRLIYAVGAGAAAAMLTSVMADVVEDRYKGAASGFMGLFSGCGAVFVATLILKIPVWVSGSEDGSPAGVRTMGMVMAGLVALACLISFFFLQGRTRIQQENKSIVPLRLWADGFTAAWKDPRLALGYLGGFVARGDSVVLTTFLALWVQDVEQARGETPEQAASTAGMVTGIAQTCALVFAVFAGLISTKLNPMLALQLMALTAVVGYGGICFTDDPTSGYGMLFACIIGVGEIGVIVSAQSLASKRAPGPRRGAVGGTFGLCGSIGILLCNLVGGKLYDDWSPVGPFLLFACFNALVALMCIALMIALKETSFWAVPAPVDDYDCLDDDGKHVADESAPTVHTKLINP